MFSRKKFENPYLQGNYAPVTSSLHQTELPCRGQLPEDLNGLFVRNGPNPMTPPKASKHHWFVGDGMLHGIRFEQGRALWYRNQPVSANGSTANTHVIGHAGNLYALVEAGGAPVKVDDQLNSLDEPAFENTLPRGLSAHTKFEAATGSIHAMCYDFKRGYRLSYVEIGADNRLAQHKEIKLPSQSMVHDCALTENYILIFDLSITFSPSRLIRRYFPFAWNSKHQARIGLLHRKDLSQGITWFDIAPCYIFHAMNAFEDRAGRVILEAMRYERIFDQNKLGPFGEALPYPTRWTMDVGTRSVTEDQLDDRASEFPRVHPDLEGQETQFGYALGVGRDANALDFNQILKYHRRDDHVAVHQLAPSKMASEPVFVPKHDAKAEDEGYLMSYVFDQDKNTSELIVLDAQNVAAEPIACIELPQRVPFGFHGSWVPG